MTEQCENCSEMIAEQKINTHLSYCLKNIKKCQTCQRMYDINQLQQHEQQFHTRKICQYCSKPLFNNQFTEHMSKCVKKTEYCQHCEQNIPLNQYCAHLKSCESRTKICQLCKKAIININYFDHISTCTEPQVQLIEEADFYQVNKRKPVISSYNLEAFQNLGYIEKEIKQKTNYPRKNNKNSEKPKNYRKKYQKDIKKQQADVKQKRQKRTPIMRYLQPSDSSDHNQLYQDKVNSHSRDFYHYQHDDKQQEQLQRALIESLNSQKNDSIKIQKNIKTKQNWQKKGK